MEGRFNHELSKIRHAVKSTTTLPGTEWSDQHDLYDSVIPPPPPPPIPGNSKPQKFRYTHDRHERGDEENRLPHVDTVVQPIMREIDIIQPEENELQAVRSRLKPVSGASRPIRTYRQHGMDDESFNAHDSFISRLHLSNDVKTSLLRKSESKVDLVADQITQMMEKIESLQSQRENEERMMSSKNRELEMRIHELTLERDAAIKMDEHAKDTPKSVDVTSMQLEPSPVERKESEGEVKIQEPVTKSVNVFDFQDPQDNGSQNTVVNVENSQDYFRQMNPPPQYAYAKSDSPTMGRVANWIMTSNDSQPQITRGRTTRRDSSPVSILSVDKRGIRSKSRRKSKTDSRATSRSGSVPRSLKSVMFHLSDAEEQRSEASSEDVIENVAIGEDYLTQTADKLLIHGPYVDDELNVFHELCSEYTRAAKITFAQRSHFSRTRPPHERVYGFLGSNKRSKWANRRDWTSVTNDFRLLDYLFRKTIRSKTQKISSPGLNIEHFSDGRRLHPERFRAIMKAAFIRRDELLYTVVGEIKAFGSIA